MNAECFVSGKSGCTQAAVFLTAAKKNICPLKMNAECFVSGKSRYTQAAVLLTSAKTNLMPVQEVMRGSWDPSPAITVRGSLNSPTVKFTASCTATEHIHRIYFRLCIVVMFHVQRFEPHACIVIEGFGALEIRLLSLYSHYNHCSHCGLLPPQRSQ